MVRRNMCAASAAEYLRMYWEWLPVAIVFDGLVLMLISLGVFKALKRRLRRVKRSTGV